MSGRSLDQETVRLPPIGFEGIAEEQIRPLKKKRRKNKHKLKSVALASQSFPGGQ